MTYFGQLRVGVEGKEGKLTLAQRTLNKEQVTLSKGQKAKVLQT